MSYDVSTNTGKVRLYIGDTDTSNEHFSDTEIGVFLTATAASGTEIPKLAAAAALRAWAAELSRKEISIRSATFAKDTRNRAKGMIETAAALEEEYWQEPAEAVAEIAQTDEEAVRIAWNRELRSD